MGGKLSKIKIPFISNLTSTASQLKKKFRMNLKGSWTKTTISKL